MSVETFTQQKTQKGSIKSLAKTTKGGFKHVNSFFQDFKDFLSSGNCIDLAIGLIVGTSFSNVINSAVFDIITPIISLGGSGQLNTLYAFLRLPLNCTENCYTLYPTPTLANLAGGITWNYGNFLLMIINFLLINLILFLVIISYSKLQRRNKEETSSSFKKKTCLHCYSQIHIKATKCAFCTGEIIIGGIKHGKDENMQDGKVVYIEREEVEEQVQSDNDKSSMYMTSIDFV